MLSSWFLTLASVIIVSAVSLIGIFFLTLNIKRLETLLLYLVSFSAGAFFGDVLLHLLPEVARDMGFTLAVSLVVLAGILFSFIIEKFIRWHHCHHPENHEHHHPFAIMNLVGDAVHNATDGIIIAASYLVNTSVGIATTMAVIFHEVPQEIGDFGVLVHGGFSKGKALLWNFITALSAILGAIIALIIGEHITQSLPLLLAFAAGNFLYIAGADLIPELHKETEAVKSVLQLLAFLIGVGVMALLLLLG